MPCKICNKLHQTKNHKIAVWQANNKDKVSIKNRKWRQSNREQLKEIARKYRKTPSGKEAVKRAVRKYEAKNRERVSAWKKAEKIPLKPCEVCGKEPTHRHHPDITKPLEVKFLCPLHHKEIHRDTTNLVSK